MRRRQAGRCCSHGRPATRVRSQRGLTQDRRRVRAALPPCRGEASRGVRGLQTLPFLSSPLSVSSRIKTVFFNSPVPAPGDYVPGREAARPAKRPRHQARRLSKAPGSSPRSPPTGVRPRAARQAYRRPPPLRFAVPVGRPARLPSPAGGSPAAPTPVPRRRTRRARGLACDARFRHALADPEAAAGRAGRAHSARAGRPPPLAPRRPCPCGEQRCRAAMSADARRRDRGLRAARAFPLRAFPLRAFPLRACPLRARPLRARPLRACPLRAFPLRACPLLLALLLPRPADGCGDPPRFETMKIKDGSLKSSYDPGDQVEYSCRPGYKTISGKSTSILCQNNNTWTTIQEACEKRVCAQISEPINGHVTYINSSRVFGSMVSFTCNEGYLLSGHDKLYCELSGNAVNWNADPPQCKRITCKAPEAIPNGKYSNSDRDTFEYGEVVTYSCDANSGGEPFSLVGNKDLVCRGQEQWSSSPPECKVVKCLDPVVNDGRLVAGFRKTFHYKDTVTFECEKDFNLIGQSTVSCGANSTWVPELPTCIKGSKPSPPEASSPIPGSPGSPKPTSPSVPSDSDRLGTGLTVLIVLAVVAAFAVIGVFLYKYQQKRKKRNIPASAEYSTYQNKSSTLGEPSL